MQETGCIGYSELYQASAVFQKYAQEGLEHSFDVFDETFKRYESYYERGEYPASCSGDSWLISVLIGRNSDLIRWALVYFRMLAHSQYFGVRIAAPILVKKIRAFVRMLRHCADRSKWNRFDELDRLIRECITYISNERNHHLGSEEFTDNLKKQEQAIITCLCNPICEAVIGRESDMEQGFALPLFNTGSKRKVDWFSENPSQNAAKLNAIRMLQEAKKNPREIVYTLAKALYRDQDVVIPIFRGTSRSYKDVVRYIQVVENPPERYRESIDEVRKLARDNPKGEDAFYHSVLKTLQTKASHHRRKRHDPAAPKGPYPIPDRDWGTHGGGWV